MKNDTDKSESEESSTEGEYSVIEFSSPTVDFASWSPEPPAGLHFMCIHPIHQPYTKPQQRESRTKIKAYKVSRKKRLDDFKSGRSVILTGGNNVVDERKLRNAASQNDHETVTKLLDKGTNPCCKDEKSRTPLHLASSQGHELVVQLLLERGADVNQKDILGNTPLHLAVTTAQVPVVSLLLKADPDLHLMNDYGTTPFNLAKSRLQFLSSNQGYTTHRLRNEVTQVSEMMKTYLNLSGLKSESEQVDELCQQLQQASTREEVDNISSLLTGFTKMSLQKKS